MNARNLLHRFEYALYRAVVGGTQRLPQSALRRWGRGIGRIAYVVMRRRRRLTLDNLARALPKLDAAERQRIARDCFAWQGVIHHEQVWAMGRLDEIVERCEMVGVEHLLAAQARGKGVFVLTGHYGCWEIAGYPLGRLLGKLHIVARPQNNPWIAADFERLREGNGNVQIDRNRAGFRMLKVLKQGGAIGVAIDQRVRPSQAVLVPFLGRYAWTSRLPAFLSTVTGCATVPMVCVPLEDGRYRMTIDAPILPEGEGEDEIERLTRRYNEALEPYVRARPELWLWLHSRWQRTTRHRRPEVIERLVREARLPAALSLGEVARRSGSASAARRLERLVADSFLEDSRHLLLHLAPPPAGAGPPGTAPAQGSPVAGALGEAFARRGHATRYFERDALLERLAQARSEGRLQAAMRDLDPTAFLVIDHATPRRLDPARLALFAGFLRHRLERGSVALVGADAGEWREAARGAAAEAGDAIRAFLAAGETITFSAAEVETFTVAPWGSPLASRARDPESEAQAPAV